MQEWQSSAQIRTLGVCNEDSEASVEGSCGYTDQCRSCGRYMCGDICTDDQNGCMCGNSILTSWHTQHYCCLPPEERCSVRVRNKKLVTVCRRGRALHKSEPCHGACNEESEASVEGTRTSVTIIMWSTCAGTSALSHRHPPPAQG